MIANLNDKGGYIRIVPMPGWVKNPIDEWPGQPESLQARCSRPSVNRSGALAF